MSRRSAGILGLNLFLVIAALFYLYPLFLVAINSVKTFKEIMDNAVALPASPVFDNFVTAFNTMGYPRLALNTLMAEAGLTAGSCLEGLRRTEGDAAVEKVRRDVAEVFHK